MNNLNDIAAALQQYTVVHGEFPPAYTVDANGKPLHSWRTLILPYLDQLQLYKSIDLTKPWDDPVNTKARETTLPVYSCPDMESTGNATTYLAVVTPDSCMRPGKSQRFEDIADGVRNTLVVIEVDTDHAVPWMSPMDANEQVVLQIGLDSSLTHPGGMHAAYADGHATFLEVELPADQRRAIISSAGGDRVTTSAR